MSTDGPPTGPNPGRPNHLPLGLLGMVGLIVAVESFVMRHDHDLSTMIASNWRIEGSAPYRYASKHEILCFGDSMVKFGVQPKALAARLGKSAYNFALYCGSAPSSYFMLRRAFDSGARPLAIVVDYQPELIMNDPLRDLSRVYPETLTLGETVQLCWDGRKADRVAAAIGGPPQLKGLREFERRPAAQHFAEFVVAELLPSARKRHEIRASVLAAIRGESASIKDRVLASKRNWKVNQGAEVLAVNPHYRGEVPDAGAYPAMFWTPWRVDPLNAIYIEKFLKLAAERKVPVFWVLQPNAPEVDARRERLGYNAQYEAFVREKLERHPGLTVVDGRHINYPYQIFTDPVHLDRHGATAYTLGLAEVLKGRLLDRKPGERWVALPDRREEAATIALEDTAESAVVLRAEEGRRRR